MALLKYLLREGPVLKCDTLKKETKPVKSALNGLLMTSKQRLATSTVRLGSGAYSDYTPEDRAMLGGTSLKTVLPGSLGTSLCPKQ